MREKRPHDDGKRATHQGRSNAELQQCITPEWSRQAIDPPAEQSASDGQASEERTHAGCHRMHVDADHQRDLLDPQSLINEGGSSRSKEQECR